MATQDLNAAKTPDDGEEKDEIKPTDMGMPPSFYDADVEKWTNKFKGHVTAREAHKKQMARTMHVTCLTRNTNIKSVDDRPKKGKKGASVVQTTEAEKNAKPSLFNQVLKRRKSR